MPDKPELSTIEIGDVIAGRYEIRGVVGRGGMGCIYQVYDRVLEEEVALKTLLPDHVDDDMILERFVNEARIARSLSHPNIVRVHDIGKAGGMFYISMELLAGRSLRQMLDRLRPGQRIPIAGILRMFDALCAALDYAHTFTVHRDIKPENVMVLPDGSIKLMDFGISKLMAHTNLTSASIVMGTPHYMPPEQLKNTSTVDARADIYSVGVMLYEVITGDRPAALAQPASTIRGEIPASIDPIIEKCCQADPAKRYATVADLRAALRVVRVAIEQTTDPRTPQAKHIPQNVERESSGVPWGTVAASILLMAVLAGAFVGLKWAEERRRSLMENATPAVVTVSPQNDGARAVYLLDTVGKSIADLQERAQAALESYSDEDGRDVIQPVLDRGRELWSAAQGAGSTNPDRALDLAWDAVGCFLAPLLWDDRAVFVPPMPPSVRARAAGFFLDARPVSRADFRAFCGEGDWRWPEHAVFDAPDTPMDNLTYYDALAFAASSSRPARVPTRAEWDRAFSEMRPAERRADSADLAAQVNADAHDTGEDAVAPRRKIVTQLEFPTGAFGEWTSTPIAPLRASDAAPGFGDRLWTCSGHWTGADEFVLDDPAPWVFEGGDEGLGFRVAYPLPRTVSALNATIAKIDKL